VEAGIGPLRITHVAALVRDIDGSIELLHTLLGWGPWSIYNLVPPRLRERRYRDEPGTFGMIGAETHVGPIDFALNQARTGPSIYDEYLARRGEGLHHLACMSGKPGGGQRVRAHFSAAGIAITMTGRIDQAIEFFYFDTEPALAVAIESGSGHAIGLPPDRVFPPDGSPTTTSHAALAEISVVVGDLKKTMQSYQRLLGWGPWQVREIGPSGLNGLRRGADLVGYTGSTARTQVGPVVFELFQPKTGPSVESMTLATCGPGLHHVTCTFESNATARVRDLLTQRNIEVELTGRLDGVEFWYLDTTPRLKLLFTNHRRARSD
jgi:methylmalonyl-CoA/ethylmalonyl-CoA epimerase